MAESSSGLFKLPAELRNNIYEYCFAPKHAYNEIDLLASEPPSKTPLLACHQFYAEACGVYRSAYRSYWTENHFLAKEPSPGRIYSMDNIMALSAKDVNQIRHLELRFGDAAENEWSYQLVDAFGVWLYKAPLLEPDESEYFVISRNQTLQRFWRMKVSDPLNNELSATRLSKSEAYASMRCQICMLLSFDVVYIANECE